MQPFPQIFPVQKYKSGIATKHKILPKKVKQILNVKFSTCKCRQDWNILIIVSKTPSRTSLHKSLHM